MKFSIIFEGKIAKSERYTIGIKELIEIPIHVQKAEVGEKIRQKVIEVLIVSIDQEDIMKFNRLNEELFKDTLTERIKVTGNYEFNDCLKTEFDEKSRSFYYSIDLNKFMDRWVENKCPKVYAINKEKEEWISKNGSDFLKNLLKEDMPWEHRFICEYVNRNLPDYERYYDPDDQASINIIKVELSKREFKEYENLKRIFNLDISIGVVENDMLCEHEGRLEALDLCGVNKLKLNSKDIVYYIKDISLIIKSKYNMKLDDSNTVEIDGTEEEFTPMF